MTVIEACGIVGVFVSGYIRSAYALVESAASRTESGRGSVVLKIMVRDKKRQRLEESKSQWAEAIVLLRTGLG